MAKKKKILSLPDKMIKFIETLVQPTGDGVLKPFTLLEFQKEMIREVYGPTDKEGYRTVHEAVLTIGRKNGKTSLCAAIALCHLWLPGLVIPNQELLCLALTITQANNLFKSCAEFIRLDPHGELIHDFTISDSRKYITHIPSGGVLRIESAEAGSIMGSNPACVFFDELGSFPAEKARAVYGAVTTGFGARKESLVWLLSTQAPSDLHILSEKCDYGKKVLSGEIVDPGFKSFIYEIPPDDDVFNEANWIKSNPGLGTIRSLEEMQKKANEAKKLPTMEATFRQLFCNQRIEAHSPMISRGVWMANNGPVSPEDLVGRTCYAGLDLSAKTDLTCLVLAFPDDKTPCHFDVIPFFWKPAEGLREAALNDRVPYPTWVKQGFLEAIPGTNISYDWVAYRMFELSQKYQIKMCGFDRWSINNIKNSLNTLGCPLPMVEVGQGFKDMNPCVELLEALLLDKRIRHGAHPVLTWNVSNAVAEKDPAGAKKPAKNKSHGRIDGLVAMMMALRMWELNKGEIKSLYDDLEFVAYLQG